MAGERDGSRTALADAQVKKIQEGHARELDRLRDSSKARKSELLQESKKCVAEQEQLRTECDVKSSHYHDVLSSVRRLVDVSTSSEDTLEELVSKLQLLYEDSQNVPISGGPSSQVA